MPTQEELIEALRQVYDPELQVNIVDLGLLYDFEINGSKIKLVMTLTSPSCPMGPQIVRSAQAAVERLPGVEEVEVELTFSPPWSPDRMTEEARDELGLY